MDAKNTIQTHHIAVLKNEVVDAIAKSKEVSNHECGYIIDCTCGFGGHSLALLENTSSNIKLICNDRDKDALSFSKEFLSKYQDRIIFSNLCFSKVLEEYKDKKIIAILADIGVSSYQLDNNQRGFGFDSEALDMRMDQTGLIDAKYIVNNYTKEELEKLFQKHDVKEYKKISKLIYDNRPFSEARELARIIEQNSYRHKKHSATLVFQAIRIEVNKELDELEHLFSSIEQNSNELIKNKSIVCIISFHSLEDKIVKNYFKKWAKNCICDSEVYKCECGGNNQKGMILTKKPITPTSSEIRQNPRSSSSKMRVFAFGLDKFSHKNKVKNAKQ